MAGHGSCEGRARGFSWAMHALFAVSWGNLPQLAMKGACMASPGLHMHFSQLAGEASWLQRVHVRAPPLCMWGEHAHDDIMTPHALCYICHGAWSTLGVLLYA